MVPIGRPDHAATAAPADPRGPSARYSRDGLRALGVEEEFHLVDLVTRRASARAPEVLAALPGGPYVAEMSSCMVETNTEGVRDLGDLQAELVARRAVLRRAARPLGVGVVAAGTVPVVAVSYTHLDVYKRQVPTSVNARFWPSNCDRNWIPSGLSGRHIHWRRWSSTSRTAPRLFAARTTLSELF